MRHDFTLSTLQARTILAVINELNATGNTKSEIEKAAENVINFIYEEFPDDFSADIIGTVEAFTLSNIAKKSIKNGILTVFDYIAILADVKRVNESQLNDFGAFGDLYEVLVRIALVKKACLIRPSMLTVKSIYQNDVVSKKYGIIEIGHNGKTFSQGTLLDYMAGKYQSVIYGVFEKEDKEIVYNYCATGQYEKAVDYISEYSAIWSDKYQFQVDMNNLTRGQGIVKKGGNIQVVYNPSKHNAFIMALENGMFESLKDRLTSK